MFSESIVNDYLLFMTIQVVFAYCGYETKKSDIKPNRKILCLKFFNYEMILLFYCHEQEITKSAAVFIKKNPGP